MNDAPASLTPPPEGYADWLADLKCRIHTAQQRATLAVNQELVLLYWHVGRRRSGAAGGSRLGRQGDRVTGAEFAYRFSRDEGVFAAQSKLHARFAQAWPDTEFVQEALHDCPGITSWRC
jgi:hypothetical protein